MAAKSPVFELRVALTVDNYEAAVAFYRDILGLPLDHEFKGGSVFAAGKATLEILSKAEAGRVDEIEVGRIVGAPVRIAMEVTDSAKTGEAMEAAGATRLGAPVTTPWGHKNVRLQTAEGVQITLFTVTPPSTA
jgi:catechol 2,3-dioxygenase-like lactoylglutathione lyase family enzyme